MANSESQHNFLLRDFYEKNEIVIEDDGSDDSLNLGLSRNDICEVFLIALTNYQHPQEAPVENDEDLSDNYYSFSESEREDDNELEPEIDEIRHWAVESNIAKVHEKINRI